MAGLIGRENILDYGELLIRDYLSSRGYTNTLEALTREMNTQNNNSQDEEKKDGTPRSIQQQKERRSVDSWYLLNQRVNLPGLLARNAAADGKQYQSVMEVLIDSLITDKNPPKKEEESIPPYLKLSKTSPAFSFPNSAGSSSQRPFTTAGAVAGAATAPMGGPGGDDDRPLGHSLSSADVARPSTGAGAAANSPDRSPKSSHQSKKKPGTSATGSLTKNLKNGGDDRAQTAPLIKRTYKPTVAQSVYLKSLKDKSQESWIPENIRQGMVRRDLTVARENINTTLVREEAAATERSRHRLNALEKSHANVKYGIERRARCGLCCMEFLPINLVLSVPLKAVLDMRESWGTKFDPNPNKKLCRMNKNMQSGPMVYSSVRVCTFCAQLFTKQQEVYRPSYALKEAEKKRKEEELALSLSRAYWDPLKKTEEENKEKDEKLRRFVENYENGIIEPDDEEKSAAMMFEGFDLKDVHKLKGYRKTVIRTTSSGRIVRERLPTQISIKPPSPDKTHK